MLFPRLVDLYERRGFQVLSSVAPILWVNLATDKTRSLVDMPNDRLFTYILRNARFCSHGGGLHMTELYLLECLVEVISPKRIFVIGNAFGWSTLALALCFPKARVVAIDSGGVHGGDRGIELVNEVAKAENLDAMAVAAISPQDVSQVARDHLGGAIDLVLVDGDHNNAQQAADFEACRAVASIDCIYLLHDVLNWNMRDGLQALAEAHADDLSAELLTRTASGMGVLYPKAADRLASTFKTFVDPFAFSWFGAAQPE